MSLGNLKIILNYTIKYRRYVLKAFGKTWFSNVSKCQCRSYDLDRRSGRQCSKISVVLLMIYYDPKKVLC